MRKWLAVILLGCFVIALGACGGLPFDQIAPWFVVTVHAGALDTQPNTLESIQVCLAAAGAGNIEVDVRFLEDGTPVLAHDEETKDDAVTLDACLRLVAKSKAGINLDMKETTNLPAVAALVRTYHLEKRAFFTGIAVGDMERARGCGVAYYLSCSPEKSGKDAAELVRQAKESGALGLNISYKTCSAQLIEEARNAGLLVNVWTVDRTAAMKRMLRLGVDGVTTRRPDKLKALCDANG
jgi:glycerophosphoryl diester phosphodiesterase